MNPSGYPAPLNYSTGLAPLGCLPSTPCHIRVQPRPRELVGDAQGRTFPASPRCSTGGELLSRVLGTAWVGGGCGRVHGRKIQQAACEREGRQGTCGGAYGTLG